MTDDKIRDLTEKHEHALERLESYEAAQRGNKRWMYTALLAALGVGGGSGGLAYFDSAGDDTVQTVVAMHIATAEQHSKRIDDDISHIMERQQKLRDAIVRLQVTVERLSDGNGDRVKLRAELREIEALLGAGYGQRKSRGQEAPASESLEQLKGRLFAD